jgi:hypothetical protein
VLFAQYPILKRLPLWLNECFGSTYLSECGLGSVVGIATTYGLDGPGSSVPGNFFRGGGGSTNSVDDREKGDLGSVAP